MSNLAEQERYYTYEEYLEITRENDGILFEYIDGEIYAMASPSTRHGDISTKLAGYLSQFLRGRTCKVFHSPVDVKFNFLNKKITIIPDILVVCDKSKIKNDGIHGAPDFIIEVLSPSNSTHDTITKLKWYRLAGVREYWIVDPIEKTVQVYVLENGKYINISYSDDDIIPVHVLEGCEINLAEVFHDIITEEDMINQKFIGALKASGVNISDEQIEKAVKLMKTED